MIMIIFSFQFVSGKGLDALDRVIRARTGRSSSAPGTSSPTRSARGLRRRMNKKRSRGALDGLDDAFDDFYMKRKEFFAAKATEGETTPEKSPSVDPEMIAEIKVQLDEEMSNTEYLRDVLPPEIFEQVTGLRDKIRREKEEAEKSIEDEKIGKNPTDGSFPKMGGASGQDNPSFYIISDEDGDPKKKKGGEHDPR